MPKLESNDPLHGLTLEMILTHLVEKLGWEAMAKKIRIKCFSHDPSLKSSLTFLRKTPWARTKVETLYLRSTRKRRGSPPSTGPLTHSGGER